MCLRQARRELPPVPVSAAATEQPRVIRGASLECPDSDSEEEDNLDLGVWYREVHAAAAPVRSADLRRVESSHGNSRIDISSVQCLGLVKSKGTRRGARNPSRKNDLKKGHAVETKWGPYILKAKCVNGWNCDFRDSQPGGWFFEYKDCHMFIGNLDSV